MYRSVKFLSRQEDNPGGNNHKSSGRLTRLYVLALTAVALLTITGQLLVQHAINNQLSDAHVVNEAGCQRYTSQQICKVALLLYSETEHKGYEDQVRFLESELKIWRKRHYGLQNGDVEMNLPGNNSARVKYLFKELDPYFDEVYYGVDNLINLKKASSPKEKLAGPVKIILDNEKAFLDKMNTIVYQYDNEAKDKVIFLKKIEKILLFITLIVLLLEGLFVFRPAANKIKDTITKLIKSQQEASSLAMQLLKANDELEKTLKDLRDLGFALDYATIMAKTDKYGVINYVNEKFCEISKYTKEELIGNRFNILSGHYHSKLFFDNLWETISKGQIWNNEIKNRAKDGSYFWLDATIVPVLDKDNTPTQYIAIYTDVTERFRQSINEQKVKSSLIIEGQEKERKKIARELHDGLGQMLTGLKFTIESLKGAPGKKEKQTLEDVKKMILDTIVEVRRISFNLMPSVLNDFGIVPALKHLTEQVSNVSKRKVTFVNHSHIERLPKQVEINLYRIVQEALNNAIKYSDADEVKVELLSDDSHFEVEISDNGKGFLKSSLGGKTKDLSGNGIQNIQERTSLINGQFRIQSSPGKGTKLYIKIPLKIKELS
ncbi:MAG: PAS domain-containing protein [Cytophagaceae bacterium]